MILEDILKVVQMILAASLIFMVVIQGKGSGVSGMFGGGGDMGITKTRRGLEKTMFQVTIALSVLFVGNAIVQLLIQ